MSSPKLLKEFERKQQIKLKQQQRGKENSQQNGIQNGDRKSKKRMRPLCDSQEMGRKLMWMQKSKKRRSTAADLDADVKRAKVLDFLEISENYIKDAEFLVPRSLSFGNIPRENDTMSDISITSSNISPQNVITRDLNYYYSDTESNCSTIITNLQYLRDLHKTFSFSSSSSDEKSKSSRRSSISSNNSNAKEEYLVKKVLRIGVIKRQPHFLVAWHGYPSDQNTWEPLQNVYDCQPFEKFLAQQWTDYEKEIEELTQDLNAVLTQLSDTEAFPMLDNFNLLQFQCDLLLLVLFRINRETKTKTHEIVFERTRLAMTLLPFYQKRCHQLKIIKKWESRINATDKSSNLRVENIVDFEVPPTDFVYINDVFPGEGVVIPEDPIMGCECAAEEEGGGCSRQSNCCGKKFGSKFAYNKTRAVAVPQGTAIVECNKYCKCGPDCLNRVVQRGRKNSLCIFKTKNGCGWGVRTLRVIAAGQFICEYVGEIITHEETERRGKIYDAQGRTYLFDLDFNSKDNPYTIDAAKYGNMSHFINHSCDPNLGVWVVYTNCLDVDLSKICLFSLRRIEAGEELTFDYVNQLGEDSLEKSTVETVDNKGSANNEEESPDDEQQMKSSSGQIECKCGTAKCRKYLF